MKKLMVTVVLLASIGLPATPLAAQAYKVGFVNLARIQEKAPQLENARKQLESEFAARDRKLTAARKEIRKLEDKLVRDGAIMTEEKVTRLKRDIRTRKREVKRQYEEFRDDVNLRQNELQKRLLKQVLKTIEALAEEKKFDLVIGEGVFYASKRVNITSQVIQRLKREYRKTHKK